MADGSVRLYCFHHAGAGVSAFARWQRWLGTGLRPVPVLLPGRAGRRAEPRIVDRHTLVEELTRILSPLPDQPFLMYGHSLGALVAYAAVDALRAAGLPGPAALAVGACPPPDAPVPLLERADVVDEDLLCLLDGLGALPAGTPAGSVWHRTVLPVLRDDLRLARSLRADPVGPVDVPVLAVAGRDDPMAGAELMAGWARWTTAGFTLRTVPGDHFFVRDRRLPRLLSHELSAAIAGAATVLSEG